MDKIYGLPHNPSIGTSGSQILIGVAEDYSSYEQYYLFDLWKWNSSTNQWEYKHTHTATASSGVVSYSDNVVSELGCGYYLYGIWARNTYLNGVQADQFGGFTPYAWRC